MSTPDARVIILFRSRLRADAEPEYSRRAARMEDPAHRQPGFLAIKTFRADDGQRVSIVEFASDADARAWRAHPEHVEAQRLGRERFYAEYEVTVCAPIRATRFRR